MDLKTLIKTAVEKAGLPEAWAKLVKAEKDEDVQPAVDKLKDLFSTLRETGKSDIAGLLKDVGLEEELSAHVQSETDRRVTQALKTHEAKMKEKILAEKKEPEKPAEKKEVDVLAEVKAMIGEMVKPLQETVETLKTEKAKSERQGIVAETLKEAGLDAKYAKYVTGDDADGIKKSVSEIKQDMIDRAIEGNGKQPGKGNLSDVGDKLAEEAAEAANKGGRESGDFVGMSASKK